MLTKPIKTLCIDSLDTHLDEENTLVIHPKKLHLIDCIEKESFDKCVIMHTSTDLLRGKGFFNIFKALKDRAICTLFVYQPIIVMQELDAGEIEANAKIGGFSDIKIEDYENWEKQGDKDVQIKTLKMTMVKDLNNKK